jgi:hypothetical protein
MVMDPTYIRPLPKRKTLRVIYMQEAACFLWCLSIALVGPVLLGRWQSLMASLPADSPYRLTEERSLASALIDLAHRNRGAKRARQLAGEQWNHRNDATPTD